MPAKPPGGPSCKSGPPSAAPQVLHDLMSVIRDRKRNPPARSYTTKLFSGGVTAIGNKIMEEAAEVVEAADESGDSGRVHLIHEAADLVYHLLVLLGYKDIDWCDVEAELAGRAGVSGLHEKESRRR